jgi:hypothetical protein
MLLHLPAKTKRNAATSFVVARLQGQSGILGCRGARNCTKSALLNQLGREQRVVQEPPACPEADHVLRYDREKSNPRVAHGHVEETPDQEHGGKPPQKSTRRAASSSRPTPRMFIGALSTKFA